MSLRKMFQILKLKVRRKPANEPWPANSLNEPSWGANPTYESGFDTKFAPKALNFGCSGGGGHNAAIQAIVAALTDSTKPKSDQVECPKYDVVHFDQKNKKHSQAKKINLGLKLLSKRLVSWFIKPLPLPTLPSFNAVQEEIKKNLDPYEEKPDPNDPTKTKTIKVYKNIERRYIDVLLDIYPTGYQNAAIWNVLQKEDKIEDLKKLVKMQASSDKDNYKEVKAKVFDMLQTAAKANAPYTEINCTQAMCLPAFCDAVIQYNKWAQKQGFPEIKIKQYMTDIATPGAVHFLPVLSNLSKAQKGVMELNGIGLDKLPNDIKDKLKPNDFANYVDLAPENNPMVRPWFKHDSLKKINFSTLVNLEYKGTELELVLDKQGNPVLELDANKNIILDSEGRPKLKMQLITESITIQPGEKVASIMLGSQAGLDTIEYVEKLLIDHDKIFVFGGKTGAIDKGIDGMLDRMVAHLQGNEQQALRGILNSKIVRLGNQTDKEIAPIMTRAQTVVTRAGGLSVMEQMALNATITKEMANDKKVFVHHAESGKPELFSGISWEDENCDYLINFLRKQGVTAEKTSVHRVAEQMKGKPALRDELKHTLEVFLKESTPTTKESIGKVPFELADINFTDIAMPNPFKEAGDLAARGDAAPSHQEPELSSSINLSDFNSDPVRQAAAKLYLLVEVGNNEVELTQKDLKALYTNQQLKETIQHYEKLGVLPKAFTEIKNQQSSVVNLSDLEVSHQRKMKITG